MVQKIASYNYYIQQEVHIVYDELIKTKTDFEKFFDETFKMAENQEYKEFITNELKKIKESVIIQREYRGMTVKKVEEELAHWFGLSTFLVKNYDGREDDEWFKRVNNVLYWAARYEFLD